ncbi:hypothetical protein FACS189413_02410 [Bacteroidia bacterium]|nr:hypothetical protein FACS189463_3510 [Bacteroidia bacterium]GHU67514.1 hypothetical protein FACS189413_02410 [Bacteroidia bacterium]
MNFLFTQQTPAAKEFLNHFPYKLGKVLILNSLYYIDEKNRTVYKAIIDKINAGAINDI